ncbi:MAG: hypothetical protein ACI4QE_02030 [Acutalibacteraceae bacterium]
MKYCKKCKNIFENEDFCPICKKHTVEITDKNTPVFLCSASGIDRERIACALSEKNIPSAEMRRKKSLSAEAITGGDLSEVDILVPFQALPKAQAVCIGIGALEKDNAKIISEENAEKMGLTPEEEKMQSDVEEFGEMSKSKRTFVRIVSAFLLILIMCGVIFGTDFIMNMVKSLFIK